MATQKTGMQLKGKVSTLANVKKGDHVLIATDSGGYMSSYYDNYGGRGRLMPATVLKTGPACGVTIGWKTGEKVPYNAGITANSQYPGYVKTFDPGTHCYCEILPKPKRKTPKKPVAIKTAKLGDKVKVYLTSSGAGVITSGPTKQTREATIVAIDGSYHVLGWKADENPYNGSWNGRDVKSYCRSTDLKHVDNIVDYRCWMMSNDYKIASITTPRKSAKKSTKTTKKPKQTLGDAKLGDIVRVWSDGLNFSSTKTRKPVIATVVGFQGAGVLLGWNDITKPKTLITGEWKDGFAGAYKDPISTKSDYKWAISGMRSDACEIIASDPNAKTMSAAQAAAAKPTTIGDAKIGDEIIVYVNQDGAFVSNKTDRAVAATVLGAYAPEHPDLLIGWKSGVTSPYMSTVLSATIGATWHVSAENQAAYNQCIAVKKAFTCEIVSNTNTPIVPAPVEAQDNPTKEIQPMTAEIKKVPSNEEMQNYFDTFNLTQKDVKAGDRVELLHSTHVHAGTVFKHKLTYSYHKTPAIVLDEPCKECHSHLGATYTTSGKSARYEVKALGLPGLKAMNYFNMSSSTRMRPSNTTRGPATSIPAPTATTKVPVVQAIEPIQKTLKDMKLGDVVQVYADCNPATHNHWLSDKPTKWKVDATIIAISRKGGITPIMLGWTEGQQQPADVFDHHLGGINSEHYNYCPGHSGYGKVICVSADKACFQTQPEPKPAPKPEPIVQPMAASASPVYTGGFTHGMKVKARYTSTAHNHDHTGTILLKEHITKLTGVSVPSNVVMLDEACVSCISPCNWAHEMNGMATQQAAVKLGLDINDRATNCHYDNHFKDITPISPPQLTSLKTSNDASAFINVADFLKDPSVALLLAKTEDVAIINPDGTMHSFLSLKGAAPALILETVVKVEELVKEVAPEVKPIELPKVEKKEEEKSSSGAQAVMLLGALAGACINAIGEAHKMPTETIRVATDTLMVEDAVETMMEAAQ